MSQSEALDQALRDYEASVIRSAQEDDIANDNAKSRAKTCLLLVIENERVQAIRAALSTPPEAPKDSAPPEAGRWIPVAERLPAVGDWVLVSQDVALADYWEQRSRMDCGLPATWVDAALLRYIGREGHPQFVRWQLASGSPVGDLPYVTHWMPYPAPHAAFAT